VTPRAPLLCRLRDLHSEARNMARQSPATLTHPEISRALESSLSHAMVSCLAEGSVADVAPGVRQRLPVSDLRSFWLRIPAGRSTSQRSAGQSASTSVDRGDARRTRARRTQTPHTLRHTAATWLMQAGVDKMGGGRVPRHECGDARSCLHHHPDYLRAAAQALGYPLRVNHWVFHWV
jgi:hypothetical protein